MLLNTNYYLRVCYQLGGSERRRARGRPAKGDWKVSVFLMKRANIEFLPSCTEMRYLQENGFGRV